MQAAYFGEGAWPSSSVRPRSAAPCVNTGTLPSKTLRETALIFLFRATASARCTASRSKLTGAPSVPDLMCRQEPVIGHEGVRIRANLDRHHVDLLEGSARFIDEHTLEVTPDDGPPRHVSTDVILIATGSTPHRPAFVPFEDPEVDDSDSILRLDSIPRAMVVLGGGVIGCEYGSIFAAPRAPSAAPSSRA